MQISHTNIADVNVSQLLDGEKLKANSKQMKEVYDAVVKQVEMGKTVKLDFSGVAFYRINEDEKFKELLLDDKFDNVYMRFRGEAKLVQIFKLLLQLQGKNVNKIFNEENVTQTVVNADSVFNETANSKALREILEQKGVEVRADEGKIIVHYTKWNGETVLSSIDKIYPVIALYNAIKNQLQAHNLFVAEVDFGNISVANRSGPVADMLQSAKKRLSALGYTVSFSVSNKHTEKQWNTSVIMDETRKSRDVVLKELDQLKIGSVGVLAEYVPSEARTDRLGRVGKGVISTSQPAMYMGHTDEIIRIRQFNGTKFLRRVDWDRKAVIEAGYLLEMGEKFIERPVFELAYTDKEIPISKIGMCKFSYGTHFHFSLPVQTHPEASEDCWAFNTRTGKFENVKVPLPMFLELVLDENGIDYDVEELQTCIALTEQNLKALGVSLADLDDFDFDKR